jgi:hypothetical protein
MEPAILTSSDFLVEVHETSVTVVFEPAERSYQFGRLTDPDDIARYGPLAVSHTNATGDRDGADSEDAIKEMAYALAIEALFE